MPGAFQFTPGPIHLFARFRNNTTADYLGTSVVCPEPEGEKFKLPVMNDLSGRSVPFQLVQDGESHMVMATMNRFDITVYRAIRALESGGAGLGFEGPFARGTLVMGVSDFELILVNQYAGTVVQGFSGTAGSATADLNAGRRYFSSNLRKYKESTAGNRVLEIALAIECQNIFVPLTGGFALYSETDLGVLGPIT